MGLGESLPERICLTFQRIPYILQVPLSLYILIAVQFVPETPRFLLSKGREEEAFRFLVEYHGNGDPNDELVLFEFQEMKSAIKLEQAAKAETWSRILNRRSNLHRLGLASLMVFCTNVSLFPQPETKNIDPFYSCPDVST